MPDRSCLTLANGRSTSRSASCAYGGEAVTIGSRAFEVIELLVRSAGQLVTKDELMRQVWPGTIVEDNTIQVHISAIRKALGPDRGMLKTLSGRGYRLLGSWSIRERSTPPQPEMPVHASGSAHPFFSNVPVAASALLGREAILRDLGDLLSAYRILTLTGPGGIGKTVLAAEMARRQFPTLEGDAWFVEFASLSDPELLPTTVASTLGLQLGGAEIKRVPLLRRSAAGGCCWFWIIASMSSTRRQLCRDSHAPLPALHAPGDEPRVLRVDGECVYRVPPLEVPAADDEDPASILSRSAVELFVTMAKGPGLGLLAPS